MTPAHCLQALRDIDGVYGSFLVSFAGELIARDLSPVISSSNIAHAGPSLARLWETLARVEPDELSLTFAAHQLFLLRLPQSTLCVFAALRVDVPTLRVASQFLRPWLEAHLAEPALPAAPPD